MSAPPGFNPENSLLPDVKAPIHVMTGGGDQSQEPSKPYTKSELDTLEKYGGLEDVPDNVKRAFLIQEATARCSNDTGDGSILLSDCWAVQSVIQHLIQKAIKRSNSESIHRTLTPVDTKKNDSNVPSVEAIPDDTNRNSVLSTESSDTTNPEPPAKSNPVSTIPTVTGTSHVDTPKEVQRGGGKKATRYFRRIPPKGKKARKTRKRRD